MPGRLQLRLQRGAILDEICILRLVAQHRHDDDLARRDRRRQAQSIVVAVRHDHAADQPRRHAPARRVAIGELSLRVLELDVLRFGKVRAEIMRGAGLQRLAVLHHGFDGVGVVGAGEALVGRLLARDHRHGEHVFGELAIDLEHLQRFGHRVVAVGVRRVAFLPEKLGRAQEQPRAHFPAHDVGPLVDQQRQVAIALDPALEGIADDRLRRRPDDQRLFQLRLRIERPACRPRSSSDGA